MIHAVCELVISFLSSSSCVGVHVFRECRTACSDQHHLLGCKLNCETASTIYTQTARPLKTVSHVCMSRPRQPVTSGGRQTTWWPLTARFTRAQEAPRIFAFSELHRGRSLERNTRHKRKCKRRGRLSRQYTTCDQSVRGSRPQRF